MEKITILGSGWLGLGLAKHLKENRYDVLASYRNQTTKFNLYENDINAIKLDLHLNEIPDEIFYRDVLCILIPPSKNENYVQMLSKITQNPKIEHLQQILFISSTAVYENTQEPKFIEGDVKKPRIITAKIDKKIFYMYKYPNPTYFPLIKNQDVF